MITYQDINNAVLSTRMVIYGYLTELLNESVDKCFIFNENALYISEEYGCPNKLYIKDNKIYINNENKEFDITDMSIDELLILTSMVKDIEIVKSYNNMREDIVDIECDVINE